MGPGAPSPTPGTNQQPEPIYVSCGHQKNIDFTKEKQLFLQAAGFGAKQKRQKVMECCSKTALGQKSSKSKNVKVRTVLYGILCCRGARFAGTPFY